MDEQTRGDLKNQLEILTANNIRFQALVGMPPTPVVGGMPPLPISLDPALAPYLQALRYHATDFETLLNIVKEVIDES
ncbi:MAG TPA: hypothetical protein VG692_13610 [Gemmatimonadales bacterium]|nr:hypothetical protein [Gemmatimonadales bacterium]